MMFEAAIRDAIFFIPAIEVKILVENKVRI